MSRPKLLRLKRLFSKSKTSKFGIDKNVVDQVTRYSDISTSSYQTKDFMFELYQPP